MEFKNWMNGIRVYKGLAWADFDLDGNLVRKSQSNFNFVSDELTDAELEEASEKIKSFSPAPYNEVYLRFNDLPKNGKSKNFATSEEEKGVSCYSLIWDVVSGCYKRTEEGLEGAMVAYAIQGAPIYFVTGKECGIGSDGEPVLKDAKVVSRARFDSQKDGYVVF